MPKGTASIAACFHEAQQSLAKHRKCVETLLASRSAAADVAAWDEEYFGCVACVLPIFKREAAAERVVEFIVRFATQHGGEADVDEVLRTHRCCEDAIHRAKLKARLRAARACDPAFGPRAPAALVSARDVDGRLLPDPEAAAEPAVSAACPRFIPSVLPSSDRLGQRHSLHPGWVDPVLPSGVGAGGLAPARQNSHATTRRQTAQVPQ